MITIDDFTAEGSSAEEAWSALRDSAVDEKFVTFVQKNFFTLDEGTIGSWGPIDLAWIDAGTPADDVRFVSTLWGRIVPGGYLCLHEPTMTTTVSIDGEQRVRRVRSPIWEEILFRLDDSYEAITLPEFHKYRQSGLGIVRKRLDNERIIRLKALQAELVELGDLPIRKDILPIGLEVVHHRTKRNAVTTAMSSSAMRSVYAVIVLGAKNIGDIIDQINIDIKNVKKVIIRLLNIGLIQHDEQGFHDVDSIWVETTTMLHRETENLSDRQLESNEKLDRIEKAFHIDVPYSETEVSKICKLFTIDFARLRGYLVDSEILQRQDNIYKRVR